MDDGVGEAGEAAQGFGTIQVARDRRHAQGLQAVVRFSHQRIDAPAANEFGEEAAQNVAAADDQ